MKFNFAIATLFFVLGLAGYAHANTKSLEVDSAFYLLDLVELNIQDKPFLGDQEPVTPEITAQLQGFIGSSISQGAQLILQKKLARIAAKYPNSLYRRISRVILRDHVSFVDFPLNLESDDSPLNVPTALQVGSYSAEAGQFQISRLAFNQLNDANQAALILHELLGAVFGQRQARTITGMLFNSAKQVDSFEQRWKIASMRFGATVETGTVLTLAPDLTDEWISLHMQAMTNVDLKQAMDSSYLFSSQKVILRVTGVFSTPLAAWAKPDSNYTVSTVNLSFSKSNVTDAEFFIRDLDWIYKLFPVVACRANTLSIAGGALLCTSSDGGTFQIFNVSDASIAKIVIVDHVTDITSKVKFSGYMLVQ